MANKWEHERAFLDLRGKERHELIKLTAELGADVDSIKRKLEQAKQDYRKTKTRANTAWFRRATATMRDKGRQIHQIQARLAELQAIRKTQFPQAFMQRAKVVLPPALFEQLIEEARKECDRLQKGDASSQTTNPKS